MTAWTRTTEGWAINVDGSDAARVFSLPRLEVRSTPRGWRSLCFMPDGTLRDRPESAETVSAAKAAALEQAGRMLGPMHAAALAALLASGA